jgi:alpha-tubulin suppressor-like RCC1 family protein
MGQSHALALKVDGTVLAWGNNNNGQLGDGTKQNKNVPIPILNPGGDSAVTAIAGGDLHSYARTSEGRVLAWGNNSIGQLGDGTFFGQLLPVQTSGLDANVKMVSAGNSFSLALKEDGTVLGWGDNSSGQLGDGTTTGKIEPVEVSTLGIGSGVKVISAGFKSPGWGPDRT